MQLDIVKGRRLPKSSLVEVRRFNEAAIVKGCFIGKHGTAKCDMRDRPVLAHREIGWTTKHRACEIGGKVKLRVVEYRFPRKVTGGEVDGCAEGGKPKSHVAGK